MKPYYSDDLVTIYNARCEDVLPSIDPASVDLLLTDPPYGIAVDTDQRKLSQQKGHTGHRTYAAVYGDDVPFDPAPLLAFGRVVLWGANHYATKLPPGGQWLVWHKRDASPFHAAAELAWANAGGRPVDLFDYTLKRTKTTDGPLHPTQKPVALMRWIVDRWTEPGDLVLDPYMGSGPVAQACHELGRRYIGIELVEDYCKVAASRLRQQAFDFGGAA